MYKQPGQEEFLFYMLYTGVAVLSVPINIAVISARGLTRIESSNPVFEGVDMDKCILYVPEGSVDAYKAAPGWKDFN